MTNDPRWAAREWEVVVETTSHGCFHHTSSSLTVSSSEASATLVLGLLARSCTRVEAQHLAERIMQAAERPEVSSGGASTTGYHATVRWRFRASSDEPWTLGEATFDSHDTSPRDLAELLERRPELARRVPVGAYARAIGLRDLVESIERELLTDR